MEGVIGSTLTSKSGNVQTSDLRNVPVVALYFSAHWCPPCRAFTPKLKLFYDQVNSSGKQLEVIFVSFDQTEQQFGEYYGTMPWLSIPYSDQGLRMSLGKHYGVSGIPSLILINKSNANALKENCRVDVEQTGPPCISEWERLSNA